MTSQIELLPSPDKLNTEGTADSASLRRPETKEIHVRVPIPNYQYLDQVAIRYGIRSLSGAINFLIEFHRQSQTSPTLGRVPPATKQAE